MSRILAGLFCGLTLVGPVLTCRAQSDALNWHDDYGRAHAAATEQRRMLLVNFVPRADSGAQQQLEARIASDPQVRRQLEPYVLAKLPMDVQVSLGGSRTSLLRHPSFAHMNGQPGLAIIDLKHAGREYYGRVVSVFPFTAGKYYRWSAAYLPAALSLPAGSLTQRSMTWAVRIHPEGPQSAYGQQHDQLRHAAGSHSVHQASTGVQGHQQFASRSGQLSSQLGVSPASISEVCAESWPGQTLMDSCVDCVHSWRQSPGHWGEVRRRQRFFGFDIRQGRRGVWYATGLFAN